MNPPTSLPQVTIQNDALSTVKDVEQGLVEQEDIWVSCYASGKASVHGKVKVCISDEDRSQCAFEGRDGVECRRVSENTFRINCSALHVANRTVHFPTRTITLPAPPTTKTSSKLDYGITSIDVSTDGRTWVAGLGNGSIVVDTSQKQMEPRVGNIHKASVSTVRLIPSTETSRARVLSGSEDFSLALSELDLNETTVPPPILRLTSHTRAVTSCQLLSNGQAVSAARDGTLRLWDISGSSGRQLGMVRSTGDVSIAAISISNSLSALALQSGHFDLVDVGSKTTIFTSSSDGFEYTRNGPLDAIDIISVDESTGEYLVATGSQRGVLSFYVCVTQDGKTSVKNLGSCIRNGAAKYPHVLVATTDGLPYKLEINQSSGGLDFSVAAEYAGGPDCSPIRSIVGVGDMVWLAGDDGVIWVYQE